MGNSSVRIPTYLRKKIKQLAAEKDTSQADIIEEAIKLLEREMKKDSYEYWTHEELKYLERISKEVHNKDPKRKERTKVLMKSGPSIDDVIIQTWDSDLIS